MLSAVCRWPSGIGTYSLALLRREQLVECLRGLQPVQALEWQHQSGVGNCRCETVGVEPFFREDGFAQVLHRFAKLRRHVRLQRPAAPQGEGKFGVDRVDDAPRAATPPGAEARA
jgi:hypothetical protein